MHTNPPDYGHVGGGTGWSHELGGWYIDGPLAGSLSSVHGPCHGGIRTQQNPAPIVLILHSTILPWEAQSPPHNASCTIRRCRNLNRHAAGDVASPGEARVQMGLTAEITVWQEARFAPLSQSTYVLGGGRNLFRQRSN